MCEILVWRMSRVGERSRPDKGGFLRVEDDGFAWGKQERSDPRARLILLPGVSKTKFLKFAQWNLAADGSIIDRHKYTLDIDAVETAERLRLGGKVLSATDTIRITETSLNTLAKERTVIDPRVIG